MKYYAKYLCKKILSRLSDRYANILENPRHLNSLSYKNWIRANDPSPSDLKNYEEVNLQFQYRPLISILLPVYNPPIDFFIQAIESVTKQIYSNWELCIADDFSTDPRVKSVLEEYALKDKRIKVVYRPLNGHISESSNTCLSIASGEFIGLLDQDDLLSPDALFSNVKALNENPGIEMIYSDEDKINEQNERFSPFFKPDWSPETLLARNYICHFLVLRTSIVQQISGFRKGYEGSQDYDLILRFTEVTKKVHHIPKILYHWRTHLNSTSYSASAKSYATIAGEKALVDALERRKQSARVIPIDNLPGNFKLEYEIKGNPLVSIIIPSKNQYLFVKNCLDSIFKKTTYSNFEIVFVDNGSEDPKVKELLRGWEKNEPSRFQNLSLDIPFNFSKLIQFGREKARGDYLLLLNNDTEIISPNWIESMLGHAQLPEIGAVGCRLIYKDKSIQHAGVFLGVAGIANHLLQGEYYNSNRHFCYLKVMNNVSAITGACLMVAKSKFDMVSGLDQELTVAFNDIDFCLKLLPKGFRNLYIPDAILYHFESKSRGKDSGFEKNQRLQRESQLMRDRWGKLIQNDPYYNIHLSRTKLDFSLNVE